MRRTFVRLLPFVITLALLPRPVAAAPPLTDGNTAAGTIRGHILDPLSEVPIYQVDIEVVGTGLRGRTDITGQFVIVDVPTGTYTLRCTRPGYEDLSHGGVSVSAGQETDVRLLMSHEITRLETIVVTPGAFSFMDSDASTRQTMSREDIESVPQLGEDVFRAVNRLPGLASGDYAAHFSVRGGRHDETLILLDGLELHEPYHLKDFAEGAISIVDVETIRGVELLTGGFPAQYGNKRSGVFNIRSRDPEVQDIHYSAGLSFMNARALAMGPLAGGRGSWIVSGRSGYMDLVFKLIQQNELPSPRYHDVFAKAEIELSPAHELSVDLLHAGDRYTYNAKATTGFLDALDTRESAENRYGNSYLWSTLRSALGDNTHVTTVVSASLTTRDRDGYEKYINLTEPIYTIKNQRDYSILAVKQDWSHAMGRRYLLMHGLELRGLWSDDKFTSEVGRDPNDPSADPDAVYPIRETRSTNQRGSRFSGYLSNRVQVTDRLTMEGGARYDQATYTGDKDVSPRAAAALAIGPGRNLRVGWGHYRQIQGIDEVSVLGDHEKFFKSELTEQWTVGLEQVFGNGAVLRVEGYFKEGRELRPVYRNWKGGIDTFPETNEDRILVHPERTTARGVEIYFDHELSERSAIRAGYSLSKAEEEVRSIVNENTTEPAVFDKKHPIPQDQRHALNLDFTYKVRRYWSVNGSLAYHSGWRGTAEELVTVTNDDGETDYAVRPRKIYGVQLPSYLRFDVRATRRWATKHGDMRFFVELVNLTNHENVFGYDYFKDRDPTGAIVLRKEQETWFTILPSIGVAWSGKF